jgi:glycosyltransferase involved in cell wall biosynthesis
LGPARNTGIANAAAAWIMFVDSDDWIDEKCVEALHRCAVSHNADIVQCGTKWVYPGHTEVKPAYAFTQHIMRGPEILRTYDRWTGAASVLCMAPGKVYRKQLFTKNDITYPNILGEDVPTTYQLCAVARKAVLVSTPYYHYRQRGDSITYAEVSAQKVQDYFTALELMYHFLRQQAYDADHWAHYTRMSARIVVWHALGGIRRACADNAPKYLQLLHVADQQYLNFRKLHEIDSAYLKYSFLFTSEVKPSLFYRCVRNYWQWFPHRSVVQSILAVAWLKFARAKTVAAIVPKKSGLRTQVKEWADVDTSD